VFARKTRHRSGGDGTAGASLASFVAACYLPEERTVTTRTTSATIYFTQPFVLDGFSERQPAGSYLVDTEEELLDDLSFPVWRRIATVMRVTRLGATEYVTIDPDALQDALLRDHNAS
jgi:hypothetical protein